MFKKIDHSIKDHNKLEQIIHYNDTTTYNNCNLLNTESKYILYLYFGIASTSLTNDIDDNTSYNLYFGKTTTTQKKILNDTRDFKLINKVRHFFNSSIEDNNSYIYDINDDRNNYLVIFFGTGRAMFYDTTLEIDDYFYTDKVETNNKIMYKPRYNELITLLSQIKSSLENNKYKKIILCGHSNGMVVATFLAYILLICSVDEDTLSILPKHHNVKKFMSNINNYILEHNKIYNDKTSELSGKISGDIINFKSLKNIIQNNIYICGTAGYPILWTKVEEFNIFNNFYKQKYIHIISAFTKYNMQIYDTMTYYNKFQCIYTKVQNLLNDLTINNNDKKIEIKKLYNVKNINYTYFNFGSIVFNLINHNKINCFLIDDVFDTLKHIDTFETKSNINYVDIHLVKHHTFTFYRILYNNYMSINS